MRVNRICFFRERSNERQKGRDRSEKVKSPRSWGIIHEERLKVKHKESPSAVERSRLISSSQGGGISRRQRIIRHVPGGSRERWAWTVEKQLFKRFMEGREEGHSEDDATWGKKI